MPRGPGLYVRSNRNRPWEWTTLVEEVHSHCVRDEKTGCLIWPFGKDEDGYPKLYIDRKHWRGNRAVLFAATGVLGEASMHSCDRPPCLALEHLSWGSNSENCADAVRKGRRGNNFKVLSGEKNGRSKLSDADRDEIALRVGAGEVAPILAREYGVSTSTICRIAVSRGVVRKMGRPPRT